ncbi:dihydrolipoyllysine-residue succinyltransferase component of 2-oxoglutarate dehydrogenase complex [Mycobacterium xenopi 3993]|nr:dihydrolipoyllysine-residue succinyltransferase component of 2-oxoglutarate dehydrogenase complex [Mycobacterium xenopi 3993]
MGVSASRTCLPRSNSGKRRRRRQPPRRTAAARPPLRPAGTRAGTSTRHHPKASRIRQITAAKTRESLLATAQLTQTHEVDMTKIVALRRGPRPLSPSAKAST